MRSPTRDRRRGVACALAAVIATLVHAGCQPTADPAVVASGDESGDRAGLPPVPPSLDDLLAETDATAAEWQVGARPVEALLRLGPDGEPVHARVTYVAPDADRFLTVEVDEEGTSQEQATLATLGIAAIDEDGVEAVPPVPDGTWEAGAVAEAAAPVLEDCGFDPDVETVIYATGAPAAWDGQRWADEPEWTVTAREAGGGAVVLPPVDEAPDGDPCVSPAESG